MSSDETRMRELPVIPPPTGLEDALVLATYAIASLRRRGEHGQRCPVWEQRASVDRCNCWVLRGCRTDARAALDAIGLVAQRGDASTPPTPPGGQR